DRTERNAYREAACERGFDGVQARAGTRMRPECFHFVSRRTGKEIAQTGPAAGPVLESKELAGAPVGSMDYAEGIDEHQRLGARIKHGMNRRVGRGLGRGELSRMRDGVSGVVNRIGHWQQSEAFLVLRRHTYQRPRTIQ